MSCPRRPSLSSGSSLPSQCVEGICPPSSSSAVGLWLTSVSHWHVPLPLLVPGSNSWLSVGCLIRYRWLRRLACFLSIIPTSSYSKNTGCFLAWLIPGPWACVWMSERETLIVKCSSSELDPWLQASAKGNVNRIH